MSHGRSISSRVRALERQARQLGACPLCGGDGAPGLAFRFESEPSQREPEPCPGCGKSALTIFTIIEAVAGGRRGS